MHKGVMGLYEYADIMISAAERLKEAGYKISIFSPVPLGHELEHSKVGDRPNYVKWFALYGVLSGIIFGFILTWGTAALYVLPRGGRPIFSFTPTLLLSYELGILGGVMMTVLGFLIFARLPYYGKRPYDEAVNVDSFGLYVHDLKTNEFHIVEKMLTESGAYEVKTLEG